MDASQDFGKKANQEMRSRRFQVDAKTVRLTGKRKKKERKRHHALLTRNMSSIGRSLVLRRQGIFFFFVDVFVHVPSHSTVLSFQRPSWGLGVISVATPYSDRSLSLVVHGGEWTVQPVAQGDLR